MKFRLLASLVIASALVTSLRGGHDTRVAHAEGWALAHTLLNPTAAQGDQFGYFVAATPDRAIIGAPFDDAIASDSGAAYFFNISSGTLTHTFTNPEPNAGDWFGISVAPLGSNIIVGARQDDTGAADTGSAYVLNGATGVLMFAYHNPTPSPSDLFGYPVAPIGTNVLVGVIKDDNGATDTGAAYLFSGTTGGLIRAIRNPTPASNDWFGDRVLAFGNRALVSAPLDSTSAAANGVVHVFDTSNGALIRTLHKPVPGDADRFGWSMAVVDNNILVGAPQDDAGGTDSGAAYLFNGATGALIHTFTNPTPAMNDDFGWSVAAVGGDILIGSVFDDAGGTDAGAAYLFDGETGAMLNTFLNPTPAAGDYFGWWVSGAAGRVLIGAPKDDTGGLDSGAAYLFEQPVGGLAGPPAVDDDASPSRAPSFALVAAIAAAWLTVAPFGSRRDRGSGR